MAKKSASSDLSIWAKKILRRLNATTDTPQMRRIGEEAIKIIVRRTRLGYSVKENGAIRVKFAGFKESYKKTRKRNKDELHKFATVNRPNNTFTGQMLEGMKVLKVFARNVIIGSTGRRNDGLDNSEVAAFVSAGEGKGQTPRPFNFLSKPEINQIIRLWRKIFGDLKGRFS